MEEPEESTLARLEEALGHGFSNRAPLVTALTHASWANERPERPAHNETLEFLGDSILGFAVAEMLLEAFPSAREGALTKARAQLVSSQHLARRARELGLGEAIRVSPGEERGGARRRASILSDAFEAVVAAVYLDGGFPAARAAVRKLLGEDAASLDLGALTAADPKTALQERLQAEGSALPEYRVVSESGPGHRKAFVVEVEALGRSATGQGTSKKAAQQSAARALLASLDRT